ncbi:MAG: hypothetical protein HZA92_09865 [Verrucomicrobia bacterium]|nr:hypothetical protein [Verrucomicrobiota bacterium]
MKALLVAGMVGAMTHMVPMAHALTPAQISQLSGTTATALSAAAATIVNAGISAADKKRLAKEVAAYVAATKTSAVAAQVIKAILPLVPSVEALEIITAAVTANGGIVADLKAVLPAGQVALVDVAVALVGSAGGLPAANANTVGVVTPTAK